MEKINVKITEFEKYVAELIEKIKNNPDENHLIFLDELRKKYGYGIMFTTSENSFNGIIPNTNEVELIPG